MEAAGADLVITLYMLPVLQPYSAVKALVWIFASSTDSMEGT